MVSQYDIPGQGRFINTYVPIPFQEMAGALQNRQRQYEQASASLRATLDPLGDIEADAADEPGYLRKINKVQQDMDTFVRENPDLSTPEARTKLHLYQRALTRDPHFRNIQYNKPILGQIRKNITEAYSQGRPWLAAQEEQFLQEYEMTGAAEGYGKIPYAFGDLREAADPATLFNKQKFEEEGSSFVWNEDEGGLLRKEGKSGVNPRKVADYYGFKWNEGEKGRAPSTDFLDVPQWFKDTEEGIQLYQQAEFRAKRDPEIIGDDGSIDIVKLNEKTDQIFNDLYREIARPFVYTQSGMETVSETTETASGVKKREEEAFDLRFMSAYNQSLGRDESNKFKLNKKGRFYQAMNMLRYGLPGLDVSVADVMDDIVDGFENKNVTYEELHTKIEGLKEQVDSVGAESKFGEFATYNLKLLPKMALNTLDLLLEASYNERIPLRPSEDWMHLAREFLPEEADIEELRGTKAGKDLNRRVRNKIEEFANREISFEIKAFNHTTKKVQALDELLLGKAAVNGVITKGAITGALNQLKIIDANNPRSELTINDVAKEGQTISTIGKAAVDNEYSPGSIQFTVGNGKKDQKAKQYYVIIDDSEEFGGFVQEFDDFMLYDFKRRASGIGSWNRRGDNFYRTKLISGTQNYPKEIDVEVASEDQFYNALDSGLISQSDLRGPIPGGGQIYIMQENESISAFFERLKAEGVIPR